MRNSIVDYKKQLPETEHEFNMLKRMGKLTYTNCYSCRQSFHHSNVFTPQGWTETQISGICEWCFDELFKESE